MLKHRVPALAGRGGVFVAVFLPKNFFKVDFCLCGAILNLKAFCFGEIPDIMIEFIVYWSVPHSGPKSGTS